jgi:hypothetical protein
MNARQKDAQTVHRKFPDMGSLGTLSFFFDVICWRGRSKFDDDRIGGG